MDKIKPYLKAVVAFVAPAAVTLTAAVQASSPGGEVVTGGEWITAACACFITAGAVYAVPNKDPRAEHQDESVQPPITGGGVAPKVKGWPA